ncbi:MAG: phosphatidylglycerophosphatase A [Candidatus Binatia bacterium]
MRFLVTILASAGFLGYIPIASGTFGTLVGVPLFWGFDALRSTSVLLYLVTYIGFVAAACWIAGAAEHVFREHDSHKIVIDEVVGYLAATLFLAPTWPHAVAAFLIFRALDIFKPFPANYIDAHLPSGYGVVLDDVVSGIYSNLVLHVLMAVGLLA